MNVVVDAQVIKGHYQETELKMASELTASTLGVMARLTDRTDQAYVDLGRILEDEYRSVSSPEWFDAWYGDRLVAGDFAMRKPTNCRDLIRRLTDECGFPEYSKDRHYVALAVSLVDGASEGSTIITEDLDFFDPRVKANGKKARDRVLASETGPVAKRLRKYESVDVRTVQGYLDNAGTATGL